MSVPERPDENIEWAESPHAEAEEPEELRLYGWPFGFVPPSAAFNWLQRSVGRWIKWLEAKVDGHVHDGGSGPGSVAKVDVKEHLGWGERGYFEVTSDTPDVHRVEHRHKDGNPAVAEFSSDILQSRRLLRFPGGTVRQIPFSDEVEVELDAQNAKLTFTQDIKAPNAEISGDIEISGHAEIAGDLEVLGRIHSPNTPIAQAIVRPDGSIAASWGIDNVTRHSDGTYIVKLDHPIHADGTNNPALLHADVSISVVQVGSSNGMISAIIDEQGGDTAFVVHTRDATGSFADRGFTITIYDYRSLT